YSTSVSSMWNVWSHNLSNMFIAPLRVTEYLLAHIISATLKSLFILVCAVILVRFVFDLNILGLGILPVLFSYFNMVIFGTAIGLILIGLVFQYGTRIQALTWAVIYFIQPLCAVFFPVSILPAFIQPLAYIFPVTYFFEWLRAIHAGGSYSLQKVLFAFIFNLIYLLACSFIFSRQLVAAKNSGQIVRNDL
ncbi:MAG TPA: ABC transporter permease, partial [Candidatus Limnocylindrales bacterium]|nr:ABC transporter permease [Candidatus Limnocylindrales bacterium]